MTALSLSSVMELRITCLLFVLVFTLLYLERYYNTIHTNLNVLLAEQVDVLKGITELDKQKIDWYNRVCSPTKFKFKLEDYKAINR